MGEGMARWTVDCLATVARPDTVWLATVARRARYGESGRAQQRNRPNNRFAHIKPHPNHIALNWENIEFFSICYYHYGQFTIPAWSMQMLKVNGFVSRCCLLTTEPLCHTWAPFLAASHLRHPLSQRSSPRTEHGIRRNYCNQHQLSAKQWTFIATSTFSIMLSDFYDRCVHCRESRAALAFSHMHNFFGPTCTWHHQSDEAEKILTGISTYSHYNLHLQCMDIIEDFAF